MWSNQLWFNLNVETVNDFFKSWTRCNFLKRGDMFFVWQWSSIIDTLFNIFILQKMEFSINNLLSKFNHIWLHILKKSLMENIFYAAFTKKFFSRNFSPTILRELFWPLWQFSKIGLVLNRLKCLTLSWRRPLSYRNQFIDLQRKSVDWFLYDNGLRHERVNLSLKGRIYLDKPAAEMLFKFNVYYFSKLFSIFVLYRFRRTIEQ